METTIKEAIIEYVRNSPQPAGRGWQEPLVGFAKASDPLFDELKQLVHPGHAHPEDFLKSAASVIAYFVPFREEVVRSNIKGRFCSEAWALAYVETNALIKEINEHLCALIKDSGGQADYAPATHNFDETTLLSDWSHRSAAYICGLGTFGINRMLITDKGCCGRIGSFVTNLPLKPTPRPKTEHCLYFADGSCSQCVDRCVNDALTTDSIDKHKCYEMCLTNAKRFENQQILADACGKCLVGLPCSTKNPVRQ